MIQVILGAELGLLLADKASFVNSEELYFRARPHPPPLHSLNCQMAERLGACLCYEGT